MSKPQFAGPEEFIVAAKRRYLEEDVPNFGRIRVQSLTEREIGEWETEGLADGKRTADGMKETKASLIVRMLVNDEGLRRMSASQIELVMNADSAITNAIFEICRRHAGIPTRDVDAIAALRAIAKNLPGALDSSLPTVSPGSADAQTSKGS